MSSPSTASTLELYFDHFLLSHLPYFFFLTNSLSPNSPIFMSVIYPDKATVNHLPPEVLYLIGEFLNGKALSESLLVCKLWNEVMDRLKWVYIGPSQWRCCDFPLRMSPYFMTKTLKVNNSIFKLPFLRSEELEKFSLSLQHTRYFEWSNDFDFIHPDFSVVFGYTKNLKSLSLSLCDPKILTHEEYDAINRLKHVKRLFLHFYISRKKELLPIERLFNVLSRSQELVIGGAWWCDLDQKCSTAEEHHLEWKCEKIMIPIVLLPLTSNCPLLKEVIIVKGLTLINESVKLSHLLRAENIQKLDIQTPLDSAQTKELLHLMSMFKKLQSIGLFVNNLDLIDFFNGEMSPEKSQQLKLPLLEDLVIHGTSPAIRKHVDKFSEAISRIMKQRTNLRRLAIYGIKLDANLILQGEHWACQDLEYLHIAFVPVHFKDYKSVLHTSLTLSEQLDRCVNLRSFIISWGILKLNEKNYIDHAYIRRCLIYLRYV